MAELCSICKKNVGREYGVVCGNEISSTLVNTEVTSTGERKTYKKEYLIGETVNCVFCDQCISSKKWSKILRYCGLGLLIIVLIVIGFIFLPGHMPDNVATIFAYATLIGGIIAIVLIVIGIAGIFKGRVKLGEQMALDVIRPIYGNRYNAFWKKSDYYGKGK